MVQIKLRIRTRRWVYYPYKYGIVFFAKLTGCEPDWDKVTAFVQKYCISIEMEK